jgi:hypothetical protein
MVTNTPEQRHIYYLQNKERIKAKSALYYLNNKPKVLERQHRKHKENPMPHNEYAKRYHQEHPEVAKKSQKTWKERHPEKRKLYTRNSRIRAYGISPETYYEMLEKQGKRCAICKAESLKRAMNIDHDHTTGKVRGLLCDGCNLSLGHIERKDFMEKALKYLAQYK